MKTRRKKKKRIDDAIDAIDKWIGNDKGMRREIAEATLHGYAAQLVYDARTARGWTQSELARRVGTRQSVISRIEDSDYDGHSLSLLQRIAFEMGLEVVLRFRKNQSRLGSLPKTESGRARTAKTARTRRDPRRARATRSRGRRA